MKKLYLLPGAEYFLNLKVSRSDAWNILPENHVYATEQFKLPVEGEQVALTQDNLAVLQTKTVGNKLEVGGTDMKVLFNLESGQSGIIQIQRE